MGHKWIWPTVLGVIAMVLAGLWVLPRLFPGLGWGLDELNQLSGIASLAVAVAALAVAVWTLRAGGAPDEGASGGGDSINMSRVRAKGSVTGKSGPETAPAGDRIRMRGIRAGKDVVGKKTTQTRRKPSR
ncbi:hypothetical protein ABZ799_26750 [Nocardiopsis dassonvillei]|uniref:hypothetical protein n=1 Tax=Nocardiopsis dassonvillei TaxID=2014 RepID=UPI0033C68F00